MKLITGNSPYLTYQRVLDLFTRWINDVRSTEEIGKGDDKGGIILEASGIYLFKNHPFGEFDVIFEGKSIDEKNYHNSSCGVVITLLTGCKNAARWDEMDPDYEKEVQMITLRICAGQLILKKDPTHWQRTTVASELCEISYLFNQSNFARSISVNGLDIEDICKINSNIVSPAILTFFDFVADVVEDARDYGQFIAFEPTHFAIWMKKSGVLQS